jgi:hypothetical protein
MFTVHTVEIDGRRRQVVEVGDVSELAAALARELVDPLVDGLVSMGRVDARPRDYRTGARVDAPPEWFVTGTSTLWADVPGMHPLAGVRLRLVTSADGVCRVFVETRDGQQLAVVELWFRRPRGVTL